MPPKSLIIFFVTNEDVRKLDFTLDSVFADVFPHFDRIVFEEGVLLNFKLFRESLKGKNKSFVNKDSIVGGDSSKISVINGNALQLADKIMSIFERPKEVRVEELMAGYKLGESVVRTALCFFDLSVFYQNLGIQFTQLTQLEAFLSRICQKNICEGVKVRLVADNDLQFTYNSVFEVLIENIKKYSYSFNLLNYEISSSDFKKFINANREEGGNRNQQSQGREDFLFNKPKIVNQEMQLQQGKKRLVIFLTDEKEEESYLYKFFTGVYDDVVSCFNLFMFETKRNADLFKFYKNKGKSFSDKMIDLDDYCQSLCYYDLTVARRCKIKKIFSELEGGGDFRHVDSILAFFNLNNDYEFVRGLEYKKLEQFLSILDQNAKNRENVEISLAISENIERKCDSSYCLDKLKEAYSLGWDMSFVNFMEFNDIGDFYKRSLPREDEVEKGLSRIEEQKSQFHKGSFPRGSYNQYEFQQKEKCLTIFLVDVKQSGECSCLDNFFTEYFFDIFPRFDKFMFETEELRNRLPLLYKKLEETHIRNSRLDINNEDLYSETKGCMGRVSEMFLKLDDSLEHRPVNSGLVFFDLNSCGKSSKKENVQEFLKMFSMSKQSDPARENIKIHLCVNKFSNNYKELEQMIQSYSPDIAMQVINYFDKGSLLKFKDCFPAVDKEVQTYFRSPESLRRLPYRESVCLEPEEQMIPTYFNVSENAQQQGRAFGSTLYAVGNINNQFQPKRSSFDIQLEELEKSKIMQQRGSFEIDKNIIPNYQEERKSDEDDNPFAFNK